MDALQFIIEEGLIMIPVLYILGEVIRHTELITNRWIPFTLLAISLGFTPLVIGHYSPETFVQAVLVAGVTVFGNEIIKQAGKEQ